MFTQKDINSIDSTYFDVLTSSPFAITLRSKPTAHEWHLILKNESRCQSCEVYHRHKETDSWHRQWGSKAFLKVLDAIKEHDRFQMSGRTNYGE